MGMVIIKDSKAGLILKFWECTDPPGVLLSLQSFRIVNQISLRFLRF